MADYVPPLRDIEFTLTALAGLDTVLALPRFDGITREDVSAILDHAGRFAAEVLAPLNRIGDIEGCRLENGVVTTPPGFADAFRRYREDGWCATIADPEFGGHGLPRLVGAALAEIWNSANVAFNLCPALTEGAVDLLGSHGTEAQKAFYLPRMIGGEWTGAMVMTEPQAGSDVGALTCRAEPDGDAFRLRGQKIFISWGEHDYTDNIVHMVLARLPDAPAGSRGISLFVVPKYLPDGDGNPGPRNDMRSLSLEAKLGLHGSPTSVMEYGGGEGAKGWMVGKPNQGLAAMFTMMNAARLAIGYQGLGIAERAYQQAVAYAEERRQGRDPDDPKGGPVPIARHGDVRRMLVSMKARIAAMRALSLEAALAADLAAHHPDDEVRAMQGARLGVLTPVVKGWCTDGAVEIASTAIQIHGGAGYIEETGVAQYLRDARITPIYEGTNGIQAMDLLRRKLLGDDGRTVGAMIEEIRQFDGALAGSCVPAMAAIRARLAEAGASLARTTGQLLDRADADAGAADAAAAPYLEQLSITLGGYALARAAGIASTEQAENNEIEGFLADKLATARYFAASVLPRTLALEREIVDGGPAVADFYRNP